MRTKIWSEKLEEKRSLERPGYRWKDNVRSYIIRVWRCELDSSGSG